MSALIVRENLTINPTVLVCGTPYSGTSIVAGVLKLLGVFMGYPTEHPRCHDSHQDEYFAGISKVDDQFLTEVCLRNREHKIWGCKTVTMHRWLEQGVNYLRNPVVVLCSRPIGSTLKISKSKYRLGLADDTKSLLTEHTFLLSFLFERSIPLCIVDYGTDPLELTETLVNFLNLDLPSEQDQKRINAFVSPEKGYQSLKT